jgi:hypothetical protein
MKKLTMILVLLAAPSSFAHKITQAEYRKANGELTQYGLDNWKVIITKIDRDAETNQKILSAEEYDKNSLMCMGAYGDEIALQGICTLQGSVSNGIGHFLYTFKTYKNKRPNPEFSMGSLESIQLNEF